MFIHIQALLKTTGADDDCSLGLGHLNTILAQGGGNLNDIIFKSSNVQVCLVMGGRGDVEFSS